MALVKFVADVAANYAALGTKDADTLYFITDEQRIYKGDTPYGGFAFVKNASLPTSGKLNTLYVDTSANTVSVWNGSAYETLITPASAITKAIAQDNSKNTAMPSIKAVYDFVTAQIAALDASSINDSITNLETEVSTLKTGKADKATTLSGYGITDAYTKTEADAAISTAVAGASHLTREIVAALPADSAAKDNVIYMVEVTGGSGNQMYEEFMFLNNKFEKIGDTKADLTGYATETYVTTAVTTASAATKTAYEAADATTLASAKSYADGLASNYATAAQGAKADSAVQSVSQGTANGTISVDGTDVSVKGLGTAAYAAATDFDSAGAATGALSSAKTYTDSEITKALTWNQIVLS